MTYRIGLLFCLLTLGLGRPAVADFDCSDDYLANFDERLLDGDCEEVHSVPINGPLGSSTLRILRYAGPTHGADDWIPQVDELAARVGAALREMGGVRLQDTVSVFLVPDTLVDDIPGTSDVGIIHGSLTATSSAECFLAMYKLPSETPTEAFVFTMAHEIFHCAQFETWPDPAQLEAATWWVEGSAEYFANLALPGTSFSNGWAARFDDGILDASMVTLSYHTVVFFSWLHQTSGAGAVTALLSAMPDIEGSDAQIVALAGQISEDAWQGFAEDYLSGRVVFPGGSAMPRPTAVRGFIEFPGAELNYAADRFQIDRVDLIFKHDNTFQLSNSENGLRTGARIGDEAFAPLPPSIDTCEAEKRFLFYATSTTMAGPGVLSVTAPELGPGACCLIGAWSPTQETLDGAASTAMQIGAGPLAAGGINFSCGYDSGGWVLNFGEAGDGSLDFQANTTACTASGQGGGMRMEESRSGMIGFDWSIIGDGAGRAKYNENSLAWTMAIHIGSMVQSHSRPDDGPFFPLSAFTFTCEADDLTIQGLYGVSSAEATYYRFED